MIEIPRVALRAFRTALRRSFPPRLPTERQPPVIVEAKDGKLVIHAQHPDAAVACQMPAPSQTPEVIVLPAKALQEIEGRTGMVTLERTTDKIVTRWDEEGVPRVLEHDAADPAKVLPFPKLPGTFVAMPPSFAKSLDDAMHCAAVESVRYATTKVQLRGSGEIVATDSRELLVQSGFKFPWKDNVLIPRVALFGANTLPADVPVKIGRTATHVAFQVGEWTIALTADTESRYPQVEEVIPKAARTTWTLSPSDADVLFSTLPRLPGEKDNYAPVTVDLNGQVAIRASSTEQSKPTELLLEQSKVAGSPVRLAVNRRFLLRALQLGFREFRITDAATPALCPEPHRKLIFMPLPKECVIQPSPDVIRIKPPSTNSVQPTSPQRRRKKVMTMPPPKNGAPPVPPRTNPNPPSTVPFLDPVAEAEALQSPERRLV